MQFRFTPTHRFIFSLAFLIVTVTDCSQATAQNESAASSKNRLDSTGITSKRDGDTILLQLSDKVAQSGTATMPRLCAPIRSIGWQEGEGSIKFVPEPEHWVFSWKQAPSKSPTIKIVFDSLPMLPEYCPAASSAGDGSVMLHAYQATTFGEKLRFEPQWYKNTVGYWTVPTDYATWRLKVEQPGAFTVAVLQGCGKGQGGSDAMLSLRKDQETADELAFQTIDTGHFQNFRWNHLGVIHLDEAGEYELRIQPKRIAKAALFDVRMIHLVRQAK